MPARAPSARSRLRSVPSLAAALLAGALATASLGPARAQEAGPEVLIDPARLVALVLHDWSGDYKPDRALLVASEDEMAVDLLVLLSREDGGHRLVRADDIAWTGNMAGQFPSLEVGPNGSLYLTSENDSIGRNRWRIALTIAWRDDDMRVAGFTMTTRDTLDPDGETSCDVNLLNGRAMRDGRALTTSRGAVPVAEWTMDRIPDVCLDN